MGLPSVPSGMSNEQFKPVPTGIDYLSLELEIDLRYARLDATHQAKWTSCDNCSASVFTRESEGAMQAHFKQQHQQQAAAH